MAQRKSQDSIKTEDLHLYVNYVLTGHVADEDHAEKINKIAKRITNLTDVTILVKVLMQQKDTVIGQLMQAVQVQSKVLEKLGATEEMFVAAETEYSEMVEAKKKEFEEAAKALEESQAAEGVVQ